MNSAAFFVHTGMGRDILDGQVMEYVAGDALVASAMAPSRQALLQMATSPAAVVRALRRSADSLLDLAVTERAAVAPILARVAASLMEVAVLVGRNRRFFQTATSRLSRSLPC